MKRNLFPSSDQVENALKTTILPTIDVSERVMNKISSKRRFVPGKFRRWGGAVVAAGVAVGVVLIAVPAVASISPDYWHGAKVLIDTDTGASFSERFKFFITGGVEDPRKTMERSIATSDQTYASLETASASFPYIIARPHWGDLPLVKIAAVAHQVVLLNGSHGPEKTDQRVFGVWDEFVKGDQWVVVSQRQDESMTKEIQANHGLSNNTMMFASYYKQVNLKGDAIGLITDLAYGENGKLLVVYFVNLKKQVIELHLEGNIPEEQLISLAQSYAG